MSRWKIWTVQQLRRDGWTRAQLTAAVESGRLWRLRRGYYADPSAPIALKQAVRLGGRLTGPAALALWGIWSPPDQPLDVLVPARASRLSEPDARFSRLTNTADVRVHWQEQRPVKPRLISFEPIVDPITALRHTLESCLPEYGIAAIDSALHQRIVSRSDILRLQRQLPEHLAALIDECDERAESGSESVIRVRLRRRGLRVRIQVVIPGAGRVDMLVEDVAVVEADGREYHDSPAAFTEDRRRDRELTIQHYRHVRLTYTQTFYDWDRSERAILAAVGPVETTGLVETVRLHSTVGPWH